MVIDVLCAYLRMPYASAPDPLPKNASKTRQQEHRSRELEFTSFREVRHTIIRVIGNHLRSDTRWRGKNYDFTGAVFDGGDLRGAHFPGGNVLFNDAVFSGGQVWFHSAVFSGGKVSFNGAVFSGSTVYFELIRFIGGNVSFYRSQFTGGLVSFYRSQFMGSSVRFHSAVFSDEIANFIEADFSGSHADFSNALGTCPTGLLKAIEIGGKNNMPIPPEWQGEADQSSQAHTSNVLADGASSSGEL